MSKKILYNPEDGEKKLKLVETEITRDLNPPYLLLHYKCIFSVCAVAYIAAEKWNYTVVYLLSNYTNFKIQYTDSKAYITDDKLFRKP